jgi:ribosomal protein S18 acetylase RimI-like enzyme
VTLRLRPFDPADDGPLISWLRTPEELFLFTGPLLSFPLTTAQLDGLRADPAITQFTALDGESAVGHVELVSTGEGEARIARVLVDPARQGRGLGELLLRAVVAEARGRGIRLLTLRVIPTNTRAMALYKKLGFRFTGEQDGARTMALENP